MVDNIRKIADYRRRGKSGGTGRNGGDITWHFDTATSEEFRYAAINAQVEVDDFIAGAIGMGIKHAQLTEEGWVGPIYQRPIRTQTGISRFLGRFLANDVERVIVAPVYDPNQPLE